jgi:drug/metabolite transporter (DMT)-like permease
VAGVARLARGRFSPASLAFVTLGVVWGSNFVFMKWASEWITPGQITFLRVLFGFVPILTYAIARVSWPAGISDRSTTSW